MMYVLYTRYIKRFYLLVHHILLYHIPCLDENYIGLMKVTSMQVLWTHFILLIHFQQNMLVTFCLRFEQGMTRFYKYENLLFKIEWYLETVVFAVRICYDIYSSFCYKQFVFFLSFILFTYYILFLIIQLENTSIQSIC